MKKLFYFLFIIISTQSLSAQENYQQYMNLSYAELDSLMMIEYQKGAYDKAIPFMQAGREKAKNEFGEQDSVYAEYTGNLGFFYQKKGQYTKALALYIQAKDIGEKVFGKMHPKFATSLNNLARLHHDMGNYEQALPLFIQSKNIREQLFGEIHPVFASSLNNLAGLHRDMGNYEWALPLYTQTMGILEKTLGTKHPHYAISINNLADLYQDMGDYEKALELYQKATKIRAETLDTLHPLYAQSLNNLARVHHDMESYDKALPLFIQAKTIEEKVLGTMHPSYANSLNNLAGLYEDIGEFEKGISLCLQTKEIKEKTLGPSHPSFAGSLNNLARLYIKVDAYDKAREVLELSINSLVGIELEHTFDKQWLNSLKNAPYASNEHLRHLILALKAIYTLLEKDHSISQSAEQKMIVAELATALLAKVRNQVSSEQDKLRMLSFSNNWLLKSLETLSPEKDRGKAFNYADQNKSVLLLQATRSEAAYQLGELPDSLINIDRGLLRKQDLLQAKLIEKREKYEKDSLRRELNKVNQDIDNFIRLLQKEYPKYHKLKYQQVETRVEDIQALLDEQTALIEYVIADSMVHIFFVTKNEVVWNQTSIIDSLLKAKIKSLHSNLSNYKVIKNDQNFENYSTLAHWFYQKLLAPVLGGKDGIKNLIIVTDGELGHLPFEAFLVEPANGKSYKGLHYLIQDYTISYNYSATLWQENKTAKEQSNNGQMLAMAAHYSESVDSSLVRGRLPTTRWLRDALSPLPAAREEVEALAAQFKGYFAFDSLASERILREKAAKYAIIHLAMHGLLDEKRPILSSLALTEDGDSTYDNFWKAHEISKMELNADLVVLSACETGYGRFETGNGIASLARSFMYAGVPALVVSLWQVNDASTSQIMQAFYANLAKGLNKAEALRQAKLSYIGSVESDLAAHPAFWSPFILIGDESPVKLQQKGVGNWVWWAGGGAGLLGLLGLVGLSRRKRAA